MKRRYSKQRELIKENLINRTDHPDASMIYRDLKIENPGLSLGTVYRNLSILVETGEILQLGHDPKFIHYDGNTDDHYHFICDNCQQIYDLDLDASFFNDLMAQSDVIHDIRSTEVTFRGICQKCNKEKGE